MIDSDPRTVFKPLTAIIPLAATVDSTKYVLTPDTDCADTPATLTAPLNVRAAVTDVAEEELITLSV